MSESHARLAGAKLYFVAPGEFPADVLRAVIDAGVDVIQLRMKDAEAAEVIEIGDAWMHVCADAGVPMIINDHPDIALALGADGVHLGQDDLPPEVARTILGPDSIIGRSTHSTADIERAVREHDAGVADYIAVGPIWETPTGPGKPGTGLGLIGHAAAEVGFPWFGIGGIDPSNVEEVVAAGARRIVVVRAITLSGDPVEAVKALRAPLP